LIAEASLGDRSKCAKAGYGGNIVVLELNQGLSSIGKARKAIAETNKHSVLHYVARKT
jgi:hypothetical protein